MSAKLLSDFGSVGDRISDDFPAFQRALDDSRGGVLHVPPRIYLIGGTLRIHSGTQLLCDNEATIRWADGAGKTPDDYLLAATGRAQENIAIVGGTWDGNNSGNRRPDDLFAISHTGAVMHFENLRGLVLRGICMRDAEAYNFRLTGVRDFLIEDITFSLTVIRPNNDGVHLGGNCENGDIRRISGKERQVTGDDLVALNADDALGRTEVRGMTCGPIRNIRIETLRANACHSFVRLLSVWSPIENVSVRDVRGTCEIAAVNCDAARGCRVPVFDPENPPFPDGVGMLKDILIQDMTVAKAAANDVALLRLETRMRNFRVSGFRRESGEFPEAPTVRIAHTGQSRLSIEGTIPSGNPPPKSLDSSSSWEGRCEAFGLLEVN